MRESHLAQLYETQALLQDARGIASVASRSIPIMIDVGGSGVNIVKKSHSEDDPRCDNVQRPAYYHIPPPDLDLDEVKALEEQLQRDRGQAGQEKAMGI